MEVVVDLVGRTLSLRDPDDLQRFNVRAVGLPDSSGPDNVALAEVLGADHAGTVSATGDVFITPDAVRALAAQALGHVDEQWEAGFRSMLEYAASKGWVTDDGSVQAHVEWGQAPVRQGGN